MRPAGLKQLCTRQQAIDAIAELEKKVKAEIKVASSSCFSYPLPHVCVYLSSAVTRLLTATRRTCCYRCASCANTSWIRERSVCDLCSFLLRRVADSLIAVVSAQWPWQGPNEWWDKMLDEFDSCVISALFPKPGMQNDC